MPIDYTDRLKSSILRRFGVGALDSSTKSLILRYLGYSSLVRSTLIISDTFLVLYVLDAMGYAAAGILIAIRIIVQALFDYPTGVLSDKLGQRLVLTLSFSFYGIAYLIFSIADNYIQFAVAYTFFALGIAQESGTLQTWFDNNYRALSKVSDPERKIYKVFMGKSRTVTDLFGAIFLILGGYLATVLSRRFVFQLQVLGMVLLIIVTWAIITDLKDDTLEEAESNAYLSLLVEGVTSIFESRQLLLLVAATVIFQVGLGIWADLVIFPIYFGYTGSDLGASIFRFVLFIFGSLALWVVADRVGRSRARVWLPRIHLLHTVFFYGGLAVLFLFFPIPNTFSLYGIIIAGLLIFISHMLRVAVSIWLQQLFLDLVPDRRRNGFYSFLPTVVLIFEAPISIGAGSLIASQGFVLLSIVLGVLTLFSSFLYFIAMGSLESD